MSIGILDLAFGNSFKPGLTPVSLPLNTTSFLSGITVSGNNFSFSVAGNYQVDIFVESDFSGSDGSRIIIDVYNATQGISVGNFQIDANSGEASWMIPLTVTNAADQYTVRAVTFSNQPGTIKAARIVPTNLDVGAGAIVPAGQIAFGSSTSTITSDADFTFDASTNNLSIGGDILINAVGKGLSIKEGTNAKLGAVTLVAGTAVVNTSAVTANSRIFLQAQSGVGPHALHVSSRVAGVSFTITSSNGGDTSLIAWMIVEPL